MSDITIPPSSFSNIMSGYGITQTKQKELWDAYATAHPTEAQDPQQVKEFVKFVNTTFDAIQRNVQSPTDVAKDQILFLVFELSVKMLGSIQTCIAVAAKSIEYFAKLTEEYTKMMAAVTLHTATPATAGGWVYNTDPSKWDIGMGITMKDLIEQMYAKISSGSQTVIPANKRPENAGNVYAMNDRIAEMRKIPGAFELPSGIQTISGTPIKYSHSLLFVPIGNNQVVMYTVLNIEGLRSVIDTRDARPTFSLTDLNTFQKGILDHLKSRINSANNAMQGGMTYPQAHETSSFRPGIAPRYADPYPHPANDDQRKANQEAASRRAEVNARNQQVIENIRSRRQAVRDRMSAQEQVLTGAKDRASQQGELCTAIIETIKHMANAIWSR